MFRFCLIVTSCLCLSLSAVEEAQAQRVPGFNNRNTVSPWVNLFNNRTGGVNNYFQFVRPLQQQQRTNQQLGIQNQFLQQQLIGNQNFGFGGPTTTGAVVLGAQQPGLFRPGQQGLVQPAIPASYFNYSHYYYTTPVNLQQQQRGVGRRQRGGAGF